jgi:hypothetical protein
MTTSIVIFGNPVDGMHFVGPFEDAESASEYADGQRGSFDWWIAPIEPPPAESDSSDEENS